MEVRTPAFLRKTLCLLPLPPRVMVEDLDDAPRVVIREVDDEEDDAVLSALRNRSGDHGDNLLYLGFFVFEGRPGSDAVDAAWKAAPLVFHDRRLVATVDDVIRLPPHLVRVGVPHDFCKIVTAVLDRHPGPVSFFGVDSSACPGPELLEEWIHLLSEKNVHCLSMVNISRSPELEFPLHRLRGDGTLMSLALGFFNLRASLPLTLRDHANATFGAVRTLTLSGCALDGEALSHLIFRCRILTTLKIMGSDLTAGCGGRGLTILAPNLRIFELLQCTATTALTFDMRALHQLTVDVSTSRESKRDWIKIHLQNIDALEELKFLLLDRQDFSFHTNRRIMLFGRWMVSLPYVQSLSLGINIASADRSWAFIGLLNRTPKQLNLEIWRTDTPRDDEGQPWETDDQNVVLSCRCVKNYLEHVVVKDYRGGKAEREFVREVLRRGPKLKNVIITPSSMLPLPIWRADSLLLRTSGRASKSCCVTAL